MEKKYKHLNFPYHPSPDRLEWHCMAMKRENVIDDIENYRPYPFSSVSIMVLVSIFGDKNRIIRNMEEHSAFKTG